MAKYETIGVDPKTKTTIDRLAKKYDMSIVKLMTAMADYFDLVGINPTDQRVLSPAEELKKFRDTIISFMRKQEKDYILPVFGQMEVLMARFMGYIENEAPRRGGDSSFGSQLFSLPNEEKTEEKPELKSAETPPSFSDATALSLKMELEMEQKKVQDIKDKVMKIFNNSEFKSTGLTKKIVVDIAQGEFDEIKQMIKLL